MKIVRTYAALQEILGAWRAQNLTTGLVPTMGALHDGHLSLVKIAQENAGKCIVSLFVNKLQFSPQEDFESYPRDEDSDLEKLKQEGVDIVYLPDEGEMYPDGLKTTIKAGPASRGLEGDIRPQFFDGVVTIVYRLFTQVKPDIAVFGEKDYQQLCVIREMVKDHKMPVKIIGGPIVRDEHGLALSSRNAYLTPQQLTIARKLNKLLLAARPEALEKTRAAIIEAGFDEVQYLEWRENRLLVATKLGAVRLIDNVTLSTG